MKTCLVLAMSGALALVLAPVGGCASAPPPSERLTTAESAIRGATEVDANSVPRAALHLKLAQEQVDKAKRYIEEGANERADLALRRAQADAELAIALSKQHDMETKAQATAAKVAKMKAGKPQ